jgi:hypothetical protein
MNLELMNGVTLGSIYVGHSSGRIQRNLFTQFVNHLIQHLRLIEEDIVLPLSHGHYSHTRNSRRVYLSRYRIEEGSCSAEDTSKFCEKETIMVKKN